MIVPRKRALFGLLDADGWAWAGVKAFVWLVIIILMLGYIPDRAYYLTVNRTVDLGVLVWSPINFCSARERDAAVPGAGRRHRAVARVAGRAGAARAADRRRRRPARDEDPVHRRLGRDDRAVDRVRRARLSGDRQLRHVGGGPAAARAAVRCERRAGVRHHLRDRRLRRGRRPDDDRLLADPEPADRRARRVEDRARRAGPAGGARRGRRRGGARRAPAHRRRGPDGPVTTTCKSLFDDQGELGEWETEAPLAAAAGRRASPRSSATTSGCTAATTRTARSAPSSAATSASRRPRASPRTPTRARSSSGPSTTRRTCRRRATTPQAGRPTGRCTSSAAPTRDGPQTRAVLVGPDERRRHPRVEAPRRQRPAGRADGRRARSSPARTRSSSAARRPTGSGRDQPPREHRAAEPVLPARPGRRDRPGPQDRRRDRPAARLPERGRRRAR